MRKHIPVAARRPVVVRARRSSSWVVAAAVCVVFAMTASTRSQAQTDSQVDDRTWYESLVHDVGEAVYYVAWPTATYKRVGLRGLSLVSEGAVATFRLYGASAMDGSDLWVDVKLLILRSGKIGSLEWGDYNGFLPPGFFWKAAGAALQEINRRASSERESTQSLSQHAGALAVVCLSNPTSLDLSYSMTWGAKSEKFTLRPGETLRYWLPQESGKFDLSMNTSLSATADVRTFSLSGSPATEVPSSCPDDMTLEFVTYGSRVGIGTRAWNPGAPHPIVPDVVADRVRGRWVCAAGFKWANPNDIHSLDCVGE
jgi:hypothetical protein